MAEREAGNEAGRRPGRAGERIMNIFAIGDIHLSLSGDKPMDIFGGEWANHAERLRENWTRDVGEDDVVIVAGDSSWALKQEEATRDLMWIAALPGKKVIIKGNHDLWWTSVTRLNALHPSMFFMQNSCFAAGDVAICGSRGWVCPGDDCFSEHDEKIYRRELLRFEASLKAAESGGFGTKIAVLHFPPTNHKKQESGFTELASAYGVKQVVYGHLHGCEAFGRGPQGLRGGAEYRLVSLDYLRCAPARIRSSNSGRSQNWAAAGPGDGLGR
jgi:predicted phosphohydrolase